MERQCDDTMKERELAEGVERQPYFESVSEPKQDDGIRDMGELYPFLICGGRNTERYYFTHINDKTDYKFNIRPKYFGDESNYTEAFPMRIKEVLEANNDAKIFCVLDWDTIFRDKTRQNKHEAFLQKIKKEISTGAITICPSMPSIEYWFLLHFVDDVKLLKTYGEASNKLAPYLKQCYPNPKPPLKDLLKKEKYLEDAIWVENLCAGGKLNVAIERAKKNVEAAMANGKLDEQSYTYIYKVFTNR